MGTNSEYGLSIKELSKYLNISYNQASDLVKDPSFPKVFIEGNMILKGEVIAWLEKRLSLPPKGCISTSNATVNATRPITHKEV